MKKDNSDIIIAMIYAIVKEIDNMNKEDVDGTIGYSSINSILHSIIASIHLGDGILMKHSSYNIKYVRNVLNDLISPKKDGGE